MSVWHPLVDPQVGYLFSLSDSLRIVEANTPGFLVPVTEGTMIVASDYSGQHKEATHEAYSFLITTEPVLHDWLPSLRAFRAKWLPDNRRISFKKLNEPLRWRALPAFLEVVGRLRGNLVTIMVDRRVGSFVDGGPSAVIEVFPDCFSAEANPGTVEKMLRLASFVALILSGLRQETQTSKWISDEDEALDSYQKRESFSRLATYLTFGLTGWRRPADHLFAMTGSPKVPYWSEDLTAVADIAAGAYCQMISNLPTYFGRATWRVRASSENVASERARTVGTWLARGHTSLKHVLLRLELDSNRQVRASAQAFVKAIEVPTDS